MYYMYVYIYILLFCGRLYVYMFLLDGSMYTYFEIHAICLPLAASTTFAAKKNKECQIELQNDSSRQLS